LPKLSKHWFSFLLSKDLQKRIRLLPVSSRKPPLSVVGSGSTGAHPPRPLGDHGRRLWDHVQHEYGIRDIGGVETLAQACAGLDRAEQLASQIATDGLVIRTKTGLKAHPAMRDELAARAFVVRTLERLGITIEAVKPVGRPGSGGLGWIPPAS
jgi:hypothetical protein